MILQPVDSSSAHQSERPTQCGVTPSATRARVLSSLVSVIAVTVSLEITHHMSGIQPTQCIDCHEAKLALLTQWYSN